MGKHLQHSAKDLLVKMSDTMSTSEIAAATGVPFRTVQRVLGNPTAHHRALNSETRGRHRSLSTHAISFLDSLIEMKPDLYLSELQDALKEDLGVCGPCHAIQFGWIYQLTSPIR